MPATPGAIDLTRQLIGFNTINPPGNEGACARYLGSLLEAFGFTVAYHEMASGRTNVVATRGNWTSRRSRDYSVDSPICFTGHLDTVPLGAAAWSVDPLSATIIGDRIFGRGTSDMKGGIAAMVIAALQNIDAIDGGPGVVFVFTAGEETGCDGARYLARHDGALGKAGAIVVGEPTSNEPRVGHKGVLWLNARTRGVAAHGSMPELGTNAVYRGARLVSKLEDFGFNSQPHAVLGSPTLNVGRFEGGININSVPDSSEVAIDIRTVPGMDHGRIAEMLHSYLAPELADMSPVLDLAPVWTEPQEPWIRAASRIAAGYSHVSAMPCGAPYFTDASVLKSAYGGAPTLVLGPGEQSMAHRTDEYCFLARIDEAVNLYGDIIRDWQANCASYTAT